MKEQSKQPKIEDPEEQEMFQMFSSFRDETTPSRDSFRSLLHSLKTKPTKSPYFSVSPYLRHMTSLLAVLVFIVGGFFSWKQIALGPTIEQIEFPLPKENLVLDSQLPNEKEEPLMLILASLNKELAYEENSEDQYIKETQTSFTNVLDETTYDF